MSCRSWLASEVTNGCPRKERTVPEYSREVSEFVRHVNSLSETAPLMIFLLQQIAIDRKKEVDEFAVKNDIRIEKDNGTVSYHVPGDKDWEFRKRKCELDQFQIATKLMPMSMIVALISQYDAYIGRLVRCMFTSRPDLLNATGRTIKYGDLMAFGSMEEAKEYIVEKEVESILRDSHSEQFKWIGDKLGIPLTKGLEIWPVFIELTERRNLFVHCDGIVSSQYLKVCSENGVELEDGCKIGASLRVSQPYFSEACRCIAEIGVKLGQVIWRKLHPSEICDADGALTDICFDYISKGEYDLPKRLYHFYFDHLQRKSTDAIRLQARLNLAQAYKWSGDNGTCDKLLNEVEWGTLGNLYKLTNAVLRDKFDDASRIMRSMGRSMEIEKNWYREWPIFKEFVKSSEFLAAYKRVYREDFGRPDKVTLDADGNESMPVKKK